MFTEFAHGERPLARPPHQEVLPGIPWGRPEWILSPAYWASLTSSNNLVTALFEEPTSLIEEVAFCMLGGFGISAELNCAAHGRLKDKGVYDSDSNPTAAEIRVHLSEPLTVGTRHIRYRFPKQKSDRLAPALMRLKREAAPTESARKLRDYLLGFAGIGPKTASWITRNWLDTDDVAIIDIHVERAGRAIGLFDKDDLLPRDYFLMEGKFLTFAGALGVRPSVLDVAIWSTMRKLGKIGSL